jgi:hypothetical protein
MASAIAVSFATAVPVAISATGRPVGIGPVAIIGIARVGGVVSVSVVAMAVVAIAIVAAAISITGPAVTTRGTIAACATGPTRAAVITGAASASGSRVATICNSAATTRASSVIDATRRANHRISSAWADGRIAADRTGHGIGLTSIAVPIIHSAQSLGKDGATAEFLPLHDLKPAIMVHGWIGDSRHALRCGPKVLGKGRGANSEEEGCARQSKSVRTLHVFTYIFI